MGNGVEHVIVATGAADGEPQETLSRGPDDVVESVELRGPLVVGFVVPHAQPVEARCDEAFRSSVLQFVSRNLLDDESIVRLVLVEGADDVVAVTPG